MPLACGVVLMGMYHYRHLPNKDFSMDFDSHSELGWAFICAGALILRYKTHIVFLRWLGPVVSVVPLVAGVNTARWNELVTFNVNHLQIYASAAALFCIFSRRGTRLAFLGYACYISVGFGFYGHAHDKSQFGMLFHEWTGLMIVAAGIAGLIRHFAGHSLHLNGGSMETVVMLEASFLMLTALWFLRMRYSFYVDRSGGLDNWFGMRRNCNQRRFHPLPCDRYDSRCAWGLYSPAGKPRRKRMRSNIACRASIIHVESMY